MSHTDRISSRDTETRRGSLELSKALDFEVGAPQVKPQLVGLSGSQEVGLPKMLGSAGALELEGVLTCGGDQHAGPL